MSRAAVYAIVVFFSALSFGQVRSTSATEDFLPISVWYSGGKARAPMMSKLTPTSRDEWRRDLQQIKSLGFNTVRTWQEWTHTEPRKGAYRFENLQMLLELAQEVGLRVIIQMYGESAPDWVGKEFPDSLFEAHSGDKIIPQSAPGYCVDHPGVREAMSRFYTETARIAAQFPNFYGWDLWSEPKLVQWGRPRWIPDAQYCFCPHTVARFRTWLKQKYGTLDALNEAWYRTFEEWEDVEPPRFGTILSYSDFIDWKTFIYHKVAGDLKMRSDAVRKADPRGVVTSHASPASLFGTPLGASAEDDFLMADQVDFYGISQYPKHSRPGDWVPWRFLAIGEFSYSANKKNGGYYVGEFQSGFGTVGLRVSDPVTSDDQRVWLWSSIATGAKGVNVYAFYPMSSGYESGGFGLINLDGSLTQRSKDLGEIARFIDANGSIFANSRPVDAQIGLVYNPLAQMVGGGRRTDTDEDGHRDSLLGYFRAFAERNIPVEFIHRRDLESGDLSQYRLVVVPYPIMFTQEAARGLKSFIENGGYVVAEARLAWNDDRGFAMDVIPGMGLSEVFGARESAVKVRDEIPIRITAPSHPAVARVPGGGVLNGKHFAQSLEPLQPGQTQVLAQHSDGTPAIVASRHGRGETLLVGSFLGWANHPDPLDSNTGFILGLLDWAKIDRPFSTSHDGKELLARMHSTPKHRFLLMVNHGAETKQVATRISVERDGEFRLHELISNASMQKASQGRMVEFDTEIPASQVQVWMIDAAIGD